MLRLLVLGTRQGAADFRERAASAGAELAQRFSVRVTHVVADDDIADQDARLTRARTAGVPVLGLKDAERLLDEVAGRDGHPADASADLAPGGGTTADADASGADFNGDDLAPGDADIEPTAERSVPAQVTGDVERGALVGPSAGSPAPEDTREGAAASARFASDAWTEQTQAEDSGPALTGSDEPTDFAVYRAVAPVIGTRPQLVPNAADVRPSDVFTESALESALVFPPLPPLPPLPPEPASTRLTDADERPTADEDRTEAGTWTEAETAQAETARAETARAGAEVGATAKAEVGGDAEAAADTSPDADAGRAEAGPDASPGTTVETDNPNRDEGRLSRPSVASVAWALLPLVSVGLLTPIAIGYAARRLRSGMLYVETGCYALAVAAAFVVSAAVPVRTGPHAVAGGLLMACLGVSWLGGTVHSFLIRRRVFGSSASKQR